MKIKYFIPFALLFFILSSCSNNDTATEREFPVKEATLAAQEKYEDLLEKRSEVVDQISKLKVEIGESSEEQVESLKEKMQTLEKERDELMTQIDAISKDLKLPNGGSSVPVSTPTNSKAVQ